MRRTIPLYRLGWTGTSSAMILMTWTLIPLACSSSSDTDPTEPQVTDAALSEPDAGSEAGDSAIDHVPHADASDVVDTGPRQDASDANVTDTLIDTSVDGADATSKTVWQPKPGESWQWQLSDTIDTSIDVAMYDIDLADTPQATIDKLNADGRIVICYFSAGSREDWRDDANDFPQDAVGKAMDGWAGERWLDVRSSGVRTIMKKRLDLAVVKKCDGVEPDNVDGYTNDTGFPLTSSDQLDYNRFLAHEAHARGLSVGLKNDLEQIPQLVAEFDWALDEECFQFHECAMLKPFIDAGKAVFHVEYGNASLANKVCPVTKPMGFSTLIKKLELGVWRVSCDDT